MSGLFYPDNQNRANRARDLANSIAHIQSDAADELPTQEANDKRMLETLQRVAKNAGLSGPEDFINKAMNVLPPEDAADFRRMYDSFTGDNERLKIISFATGAMITIGGTAWQAPQVVKAYFMVRFSQRVWPMLANYSRLGKVKEIRSLLKVSGDIVRFAKRAPRGVTPPPWIGQFTKLMKIAKFGKFLTIAGALAFIAGVVAEAIQGAQMRSELRDAIDELATYRFMAKKMHLLLARSKGIQSQADSYILLRDMFDQQKDPAIREILYANLELTMQGMVTQYTGDIRAVTDQVIFDELINIDNGSSTWRNEDPTLQEILQKVEQMNLDDGIDLDAVDIPRPMTSGAEVPLPVEIPLLGAETLKAEAWKKLEPLQITKASSQLISRSLAAAAATKLKF